MIVGDGSVRLLTVEEFKRDFRQLAGYRVLMEMMQSSRHCNASGFGTCVAGVLVVPGQAAALDRKMLPAALLRCGFYMGEEQLLLVSDDQQQLTDIFNEIVPAADLESYEMGMIFFAFLEHLIKDDMELLEGYEKRLAALEDRMTADVQDIPEDFDGVISRQRRDLRRLMSYYKLLKEAAHTIDEALYRAEKTGSRELFMYLGSRLDRLYSDAEGIAAYAMQIRDIYTSKVSMRQNQVMQTLTIVTAIFMPLTLLAGWYGMNFTSMPELEHRYGYLAVTVLAAAVVIAEIVFFKRKKWF